MVLELWVVHVDKLNSKHKYHSLFYLHRIIGGVGISSIHLTISTHPTCCIYGRLISSVFSSMSYCIFIFLGVKI